MSKINCMLNWHLENVDTSHSVISNTVNFTTGRVGYFGAFTKFLSAAKGGCRPPCTPCFFLFVLLLLVHFCPSRSIDIGLTITITKKRAGYMDDNPNHLWRIAGAGGKHLSLYMICSLRKLTTSHHQPATSFTQDSDIFQLSALETFSIQVHRKKQSVTL